MSMMSKMNRAENEDLKKLGEIAATLNKAADIRGALNESLAHLVELMGLETGWVFLADPAASDLRWGKGYVLGAHHNLPPALSLESKSVWHSGCDCQGLCNKGKLVEAYNEVRCSRLASAEGDRRGLAVHASAPLRAGERTLGILNVAAPDWSSFDARSLALLTNVGTQIGVALERAQLYDMLRERRIDEQAALLDLSNQLLTRPALDDLIPYLVQEACRLLGADACSLLLYDEEEDIFEFRAAHGWKKNPVETSPGVPSDATSGPGQVLQTQRPLLVEDLQQDDSTQWAPDWLRAEGFRGHAVVPLIAEGRSIGTLVINNREPRNLEEDDLRFLRVMANQAAIAIENARLHEERTARQLLEEELDVGRQIQLSLLPDQMPELPGWDIDAKYRTASQVGGDFYDLFDLPGDDARLGIVIADVSDKGVPAAIFMAMSRTMIRSTALSGRTPQQALTRANELILKDSRAELFVSVFYAQLELDSGRLTYANAGHNPPLWLNADTGTIEPLHSAGIILGSFEAIDIEEQVIQLSPGDTLLLYTDGVTEAMDGEGELFGEARLEQLFSQCREDSAGAFASAILEAIVEFTGETPQSDDLTLLILHRQSSGS
jgi:sigma-B regulation protein RsbU (phosphoserine phosphatase)